MARRNLTTTNGSKRRSAGRRTDGFCDHVPAERCANAPVDRRANWTWSTRHVCIGNATLRPGATGDCPRPGDIVAVRVARVGNHTRVYSAARRFSRLYPGDMLAGVLGTRYATDAFYAPEIDPARLHLLTNAGLIGTAQARHSSITAPTTVELLGYIAEGNDRRHLNLKDRLFKPLEPVAADIPIVLFIGTGMNSGKTTTAARLGRALLGQGLRVALLKVTGSVAHRDLEEFESTGAQFVRDFSDYGFASTYLAGESELLGLFARMIHDAAEAQPDVILAEVADGVFQREDQLLLKSDKVRRATAGVVLTAPCAASALSLAAEVNSLGYRAIAVSGLITNSPLFVQEFAGRSRLPVLDSSNGCGALAAAVTQQLQSR